MKIYENWDRDAGTIDPESIAWEEYMQPGAKFPHPIRQEPGLGNALGRIKFMFPNDYSIYLHDTPEGKLFAEADRTFSHGCLRLEKPLEVADFVLKNTPKWDLGKVKTVLQTTDNTHVNLGDGDKMPVYIYYATAWADANGALYFRPDLYERDSRLIKKFRERKLQEAQVEH
jgi:murein L,D-transpeptidase YcbB/YkuD